MPKNLWDITNRPSTKTKLEILRKCFDIWVTVWNKQDWASNEWYVIDLFAGRGVYTEGDRVISGSPLIFHEILLSKIDKLKANLKIKLFFVEKDKNNFQVLQENVKKFIDKNPQISSLVTIEYFNDDCNKAIGGIIKHTNNSNKHPLFVFIDPTGLQVKKTTTDVIVRLSNPKDIMFNYILEGVRRTSGVAKKAQRGEYLTTKEIKTVETLKAFVGSDVDVITSSDQRMLEEFVNSVFTSQRMSVVGYDIKYPDRNDILYYLLYASKKPTITNIVKDIFAKQKEEVSGKTLFGGKEYYQKHFFEATSSIQTIKRKSLLYQTKVEYGNWTINHIMGCMHGCKFPCYAMMMARKFGWVKDYEDWRKPRLAENSLELLEKEIQKYRNKIDFVHLCFMTDPFMYDYHRKELVPEIKELTLKIIERLNRENIKVTTLTKGYYPDEILDKKRFLQANEYGITLVSLNEDFKKEYEPFSSPYDKRIASLKKLHDAGLKTWVSMEPYPTPELDKTAGDIEKILEKISFVNKIIFGKLNYHKLNSNEKMYSLWKNNMEFYTEMSRKVIDFCRKKNIKYHIKFGTPLSGENTQNIFLI